MKITDLPTILVPLVKLKSEAYFPYQNYLLSDQAIFLYFIKKTAENDRISVLGNTFQGQKHGFKGFEVC